MKRCKNKQTKKQTKNTLRSHTKQINNASLGLQYFAKRNETKRNGTLRNGTLRNGTLRNGTLRNGTLRNGYTSANAPKFFALATKS